MKLDYTMNKTERLKLDKIKLIRELVEKERDARPKEQKSIIGHLLEQVPIVIEDEIEMKKGMSLEI